MNYHSITDEELLEATRNKDDAAFAELMHRYVKAILYFSLKYTGDKAVAEDITQETFFKAWKHLKRFKTGNSFRPWLYKIARNTALDHLKKRRAVVFSELDDVENDQQFAETIQDTGPSPADIFEMAGSAVELESALDNLHPDHRTMILMHYKSELTFEEISIVMGKPINTVKSWYRRSLIKLKELLRTKNVR